MKKSYAHLVLGKRRSYRYRAPRHRARSLFSRIQPEASVDDHPAAIRDLSMSGAAVYVAAAIAPAMGDRRMLRVRLRTTPVFAVLAEVVRVEVVGKRALVAVRFVEATLDLQALVEAHDRLAFEEDVALGSRRFQVLGPAYRSAIADLAVFFAHWRDLIDGRETRIRSGGSRVSREAGVAGIERDVAEPFLREWRQLRAEAARASAAERCSGEELSRFARTLLLPHLLASPLLLRMLEQPAGRLDDPELVAMLVAGDLDGETVYARMLNRIAVTDPLFGSFAGCARAFGKELGRNLNASQDDVGPANVLYLGDTLVLETVRRMLQTASGRRVCLTVSSEDHAALEIAQRQLAELEQVQSGSLDVRIKRVVRRRLVAPDDDTLQPAAFDAVVVENLAKEPRDDVLRSLVARSTESLRAGGTLIVGTMSGDAQEHWFAREILGWNLTPRDQTSLRLLCDRLDTDLLVSTAESPDHVWSYLKVRQHEMMLA